MRKMCPKCDKIYIRWSIKLYAWPWCVKIRQKIRPNFIAYLHVLYAFVVVVQQMAVPLVQCVECIADNYVNSSYEHRFGQTAEKKIDKKKYRDLCVLSRNA